MSFLGGASAESKARSAQVGNIATNQQQIGEDASARGNKAFRWLKQSLVPVKDFWSKLLEGDSASLTSLLDPEISNINQQYDNQSKALTDFTPRGGTRASGNTMLATERASIEPYVREETVMVLAETVEVEVMCERLGLIRLPYPAYLKVKEGG